ncbi:hypothetical protein [Halohasta salina]|uniref:hypothetical protein n=1 Tax=Halohasta salina TaxID=2961621 RepID=UPI0020A2A9AA|nr:hypothetical protein [Halohasta salina]
MPRPEAGEESTAVVGQLRCVGASTVEAVGFWLAIALPLPTLVVLTAGVGTRTELLAVTGLLTANLLAFYIGHDYARPETDT